MGVSCFSVYAWSSDVPHGVYYDVFSRVIEKSALYAKVLLEDIFERMADDGLMQGAEVINLISDTGKHFRARLIIGALAKRWPENGAIISP